jgi:CheY-like chemotaxis protein
LPQPRDGSERAVAGELNPDLRGPNLRCPVPPNLHVLVIDDDRDQRESIIETLIAAGLEATGASNGRRALEILKGPGSKPQLIVLDLLMPVMDGWEFRRQQLADPELASIPVLVTSSVFLNPPAGIVPPTSALNVGSQELLPKPFDDQILLRALSVAFAAKRSSLGQA